MRLVTQFGEDREDVAKAEVVDAPVFAVSPNGSTPLVQFEGDWRFRKEGTLASARRLFLFTLLYLPVALGLLALGWR